MKSKTLSRRDFLKLISSLPLVPLTGACNSTKVGVQEEEVAPISWFANLENRSDPVSVIVIVFDAMSARHLSLYGYPRKTTPNLERFAKHATVYHAHYSTANFTTTGTASLFTGANPWNHGAYQQNGLIRKELQGQNLFTLMGDDYHRLAFAQNVWADILLYQFADAIEQHLPVGAYSLIGDTFYDRLFKKDVLAGFRGSDDFFFEEVEQPGSIFLGAVDRLAVSARVRSLEKKYKDLYPRGLPNLGKYNVYFTFEPVMDGVMANLRTSQKPLLGYLHFFPPHDPYFPTQDFIGIFDDDLQFPEKKALHFGKGNSHELLLSFRREYDEFVAFTDAQFGRLYDFLQSSGWIDNSYVVITSDHGELFERGVRGHVTQLLYEDLLRIPLLISAPGQHSRQDVYSRTSIVDLVPTFLHLTGRPVPDGLDGIILPGLGGQEDLQRAVFAVDAKQNSPFGPFRIGTAAVIQGDYKLITYRGYPELQEAYELYDLRNDPEELQDLYSLKPSLANELLNVLNKELAESGSA